MSYAQAFEEKWSSSVVFDHLSCFEIKRDRIKFAKQLVKLFWFDPMYHRSDQPTKTEASLVRKILDELSMPGSIAVVWGRLNELYEFWKPIFSDNFCGSTVQWREHVRVIDLHITIELGIP